MGFGLTREILNTLRFEEVMLYVEHVIVDVARCAAKIAIFTSTNNQRRLSNEIRIDSYAASVGEETLTHEKAASRNQDDRNIICGDFLGQMVYSNKNNLSPRSQVNIWDDIRSQFSLALSAVGILCMGFNIKWKRTLSVVSNRDYGCRSYTPVYC